MAESVTANTYTSWVDTSDTGSIRCIVENFDRDPAHGSPKSCYCDGTMAAPNCPNSPTGDVAHCCDVDVVSSCTEWCCGDNSDFYCSSVSEEYAQNNGGIHCPNGDTSNRTSVFYFFASLTNLKKHEFTKAQKT